MSNPQEVQDDTITYTYPQQEENSLPPHPSFQIAEDGPDHKYRTEIPNIVFDLDLTPIEFKVYCQIKKIAGDEGACWYSMKNLSDQCKCSERSVQYAIEKLQQIFPIGKPLIQITHRKKKDGSADTSVLHVINIWPENGKRRQFQKILGGANGAPGVVQTVHQGGANGAPKQEQENKNQKEQQKQAHVPVVSVSSKLFDSVSVETSQESDAKAKAFCWFVNIGCDIITATQWVESYPIEDIQAASEYVAAMVKRNKAKNKSVPNVVGYLRKTLENKYWIPRR